MGEAPAPAPPASTPLAAREKPSLRRWLATHKLQACALCFMVMSIALYFLVQAFAAGGALGAALAVGFFCLFCYCCDQGYRVYASEGFYRERAPRLTDAVARVGVAMGRLDRDTWLPDAGAAAKAAPLVPPDVRLEELVDTLVEVHGHQLLSDGLVNLDPHPGNVLVLDGGRLGLIDYGQVRAFEPEERRSIATVVHALYRGDKAAVFAALEAMPPAGFQCQHQKHFPEERRRLDVCGP